MFKTFSSSADLSKDFQESNILVPDQARHFVGPDLGPNFFFANATSRRKKSSFKFLSLTLKTCGNLFQ